LRFQCILIEDKIEVLFPIFFPTSLTHIEECLEMISVTEGDDNPYSSRCQFLQRFAREFFIRTLFWQLFSCYMYIEKAAKTTFVQKINTSNVDEIDYRGQFHKHFMCAFLVWKQIAKLSLVTNQLGNLWCQNFVWKRERKMLMKLTAGVDFTNMYVYEQLLCAEFPKVKKYSQVMSVFLRFWNLHVQNQFIKCWWN